MRAVYAVRLRHDGGFFTLSLSARDADDAVRRACAMEGAPRRSVVSVRRVS